MENYLYFGEGGGANATTEAALYKASSFIGVEPASATTTRIFFESPMGDVDGGGGVGDYVEVTHADTHATAGSYHRCKLIARVMAQAVNAGPHADGKLISVIAQASSDLTIIFSTEPSKGQSQQNCSEKPANDEPSRRLSAPAIGKYTFVPAVKL